VHSQGSCEDTEVSKGPLFRPYHQTLSNNLTYMDTVNRWLAEASGKKEVLQVLAKVRKLLSTGKFPL